MALRRFVVSGCSGGGKSSLINELKGRGKRVIPEAGRIIAQEQMASGGHALPWDDREAFALQLASMASQQYHSVIGFDGDTFFDRSFIEVEVFCDLHDLPLPQAYQSFADTCRYDDPIFLAAPWQAIFSRDAERQHGFEEAVLEYNALQQKFLEKRYQVLVIPQDATVKRADWILNMMNDLD